MEKILVSSLKQSIRWGEVENSDEKIRTKIWKIVKCIHSSSYPGPEEEQSVYSRIVKELWDEAQRQLECCGVETFADWSAFSLVSCSNRWSLHWPLTLCIDHWCTTRLNLSTAFSMSVRGKFNTLLITTIVSDQQKNHIRNRVCFLWLKKWKV